MTEPLRELDIACLPTAPSCTYTRSFDSNPAPNRQSGATHPQQSTMIPQKQAYLALGLAALSHIALPVSADHDIHTHDTWFGWERLAVRARFELDYVKPQDVKQIGITQLHFNTFEGFLQGQGHSSEDVPVQEFTVQTEREAARVGFFPSLDH